MNPGSTYEAAGLVYLQAEAETKAWIQAELVYDVACLGSSIHWGGLWSEGPNWGRLNMA